MLECGGGEEMIVDKSQLCLNDPISLTVFLYIKQHPFENEVMSLQKFGFRASNFKESPP
jgi:hypothetical protein